MELESFEQGEAREQSDILLQSRRVFFKIQKGAEVSALFEKGGKTPLVNKESLTGRCFISATGPDGTRTTSTTLEKPLPSLEGMTGGSRLSDYRQQKTKSRLSRVHVTPRKTFFTPSHSCPCWFSIACSGQSDQEGLPSWYLAWLCQGLGQWGVYRRDYSWHWSVCSRAYT